MTSRGNATRERLLTATREVVRRVGYANATTRANAEAAGVAE
jgi:AcrR family transcriptional regulator